MLEPKWRGSTARACTYTHKCVTLQWRQDDNEDGDADDDDDNVYAHDADGADGDFQSERSRPHEALTLSVAWLLMHLSRLPETHTEAGQHSTPRGAREACWSRSFLPALAATISTEVSCTGRTTMETASLGISCRIVSCNMGPCPVKLGR